MLALHVLLLVWRYVMGISEGVSVNICVSAIAIAQVLMMA